MICIIGTNNALSSGASPNKEADFTSIDTDIAYLITLIDDIETADNETAVIVFLVSFFIFAEIYGLCLMSNDPGLNMRPLDVFIPIFDKIYHGRLIP